MSDTRVMPYYIIEHPTRGVYTGTPPIPGAEPQFTNTRPRAEAAWLINHAHAMRTLTRIREHGVRGCYILKATEQERRGMTFTVFTKDNENTLGG